MNWKERISQMQVEAVQNKCRELIEVPTGSDYKIRQLIELYPQYLWKYPEGSTISANVMKIAEKMNKEFQNLEINPIHLYPCEYYRVMDHSTPTDISLQPKRYDKAKEQVSKKMHKYYQSRETEICIPEDQLILNAACAVCFQFKWYRAKIEKVGIDVIYAYLVDFGTSHVVMKKDVRRLPSTFGHYPPLVAKARIRGAVIHKMDSGRVDRFADMLQSINYLARCQVTSCIEPYEIILYHPTYELMDMCSFLVDTPSGLPSKQSVWIPKKIAKELETMNELENNQSDYSGSESDFEEDNPDEKWESVTIFDPYLRSFPPAKKIDRVAENNFEVARIENEQLIYLTNETMKKKRQEVEDYLSNEIESLEPLPDCWFVFGAACFVIHNGIGKRAAVCGVKESTVTVLLIDYGITIECPMSAVFNIPNDGRTNIEPQVVLVSIKSYPLVHYSRVIILRELIPPGTAVTFERGRGSKDIPTKGQLFLHDGTSVEFHVNKRVSERNVNLKCSDLVPYRCFPFHGLLTNQIKFEFVYKSDFSIIYQKSKIVTSRF